MKPRQLRTRFVLLGVLFAAIYYEETKLGILYNIYRNYYHKTIYGTIWAQRTKGIDGNTPAIRIAIITVLKDGTNKEEYQLALDSFECYALYHGYGWYVIDVSSNVTFTKICPQEDFMFARHCITAQVMEDNDWDWFLFIDADMGVINPNHLIEEYIDNDVNMIFYNRIFNQEIMAGSYLVRNNNYSRSFLRFWADYERKLPNSFHGTDNGAIHIVILELLEPEKVKERKKCEGLWKETKDYFGLTEFEVCVRQIIGNTPKWPDKVRVLGKGKAWSRDTWHTNSMWSAQDFVLHCWKKSKMNRIGWGGWPTPFTSHIFNMSLCTTDKAGLNWQYKDTFIVSDSVINSMLEEAFQKADHDENVALENLQLYNAQPTISKNNCPCPLTLFTISFLSFIFLSFFLL